MSGAVPGVLQAALFRGSSMSRRVLWRAAKSAVTAATLVLAGTSVAPAASAAASPARVAHASSCAASRVGHVGCGALLTPGTRALPAAGGPDATPSGFSPASLRGAYGLQSAS